MRLVTIAEPMNASTLSEPAIDVGLNVARDYGVTHIPETTSPVSLAPLTTLGSILLDADRLRELPQALRSPTTALDHCRSASESVLPFSGPIHPSGSEVLIFRNYVENVSHWVSDSLE